MVTPLKSLRKFLACWQDGGFKVELRAIRGVDVDTNTVQGSLESLLGPRVKHLAADRSSVGIPSNQNQLGGGSSIRGGKVQIDQSVAAVIVGKGTAKVIKSLGTLTLIGNDNSLLVLDRVNDVTELFALLQLEIVEGRNDVVGNFHTGRL